MGNTYSYFGPCEAAFGYGNDKFWLHRLLGTPSLTQSQIFDWKKLESLVAGCHYENQYQIAWVSTNRNGSYAIGTTNNTVMSNRQEILTIVNALATTDVAIEYISFADSGSYFIRYTDGTVQLSRSSEFPKDFNILAGMFLDIEDWSRQESELQYVFFGADGLVVLQTSSGMVWSDDADEKLNSELQFAESHGGLNQSTALSPWRQDHFVVHSCLSPPKFSVPDGLGVDSSIIVAGLKGETPPQHILDAWQSENSYNQVPDTSIWHPVLGRLTDKPLACSSCGKVLGFGMHSYFCNVCIHKDFDICVDCYQNTEKKCWHRRIECIITTTASSQDVMKVQEQTSSTTTHFTNNYTGNQEPSDEVDKLSRNYSKHMLKDSLTSSILVEKPDVKWSDVAGLQAAKDDLQEAIVFPIRFPQMYTGKRKPRRGILLYGPPGTGKTFLAKAVATEVDYTLFRISSGDVMSKWFGESEGLIRSLFELAREKKPSIIFIDEIDALCGHRDGVDGGNEHTARMKTELLVQMDGLGNDNSGVFVLAATNLPWVLDPAVRRRFQKRIHIPLPDVDARLSLLGNQLTGMISEIAASDLALLGQLTENFSGSDLSTSLQDALMVPVKRVQTATHFQKIWSDGSFWYTPCELTAVGATAMRWTEVPGSQLREPALRSEDLLEAIKKVKPSVGQEEIQKHKDWTEKFGLEGA